MVAEETRRGAPAGLLFPSLIGGLKATPGCLGVEVGQTGSGKQVVFAWFRDKSSVLDWYYSDLHRLIQDQFFPDRPPHKPLEGVPDDVGPVMAIASLIFPEGSPAGGEWPFPQISIELYKPLTGGIFIGGRFAPDALDVPGMKDYTQARG